MSEEDAEEEEDEALRIITEDGTYLTIIMVYILLTHQPSCLICLSCDNVRNFYLI